MTIDDVRQSIVIVNNGSGCIIQPMTDEYLYILTAKHNIDNNGGTLDSVIYFKLNNGNWHEQKLELNGLIEGENYFPHASNDIAIIKIDRIDGVYEVLRLDDFDKNRTEFYLLGYPEIRRRENQNNKIEWYRNDPNIQIIDSRASNLYEAEVPGNVTLEEVQGDSGGGIVKVIRDKVYLAGIQNRMASEGEQMGRVRFTSIKAFDEIVQGHSTKLAPILPSHLKCFSFLKNDAFNLLAGFGQNDIEFAKNFLKQKTERVISSSITPHGVKKLFESRLLLFRECEAALQGKGIWIIWLEFLTILNLLRENELTKTDLSELFGKVRLLYSETENDWSSEIDNILYSDYRGLRKNGIVIIGASKPPEDDQFIISKGKIPQITNVVQESKRKMERDLIQTDKGITFPFDDFTFVHIEYFKKGAISKKHAEYAEILDDEQLLKKLKNEYNILIDNE